MGRWRFVLLVGVLGWGVPWGLLMAVFDMLAGDGFFLKHYLIAGPLGMIGGVVFGLWIWRINERAYAKAMAAADSSNSKV